MGRSTSSKPVLKSSSSESDSAPPRKLRLTKCLTSRARGISSALCLICCHHLCQAALKSRSSPEEFRLRFFRYRHHPQDAKMCFRVRLYQMLRVASRECRLQLHAPYATRPIECRPYRRLPTRASSRKQRVLPHQET